MHHDAASLSCPWMQAGGVKLVLKIVAQVAAAWLVDAALCKQRIEGAHGHFPALAVMVQAG